MKRAGKNATTGRLLIGFFLAVMFVSALGLGVVPGNLLVASASEIAFVAAVFALVAADAVSLLNSPRARRANRLTWGNSPTLSGSIDSRPLDPTGSLLPQARQIMPLNQAATSPEP